MKSLPYHGKFQISQEYMKPNTFYVCGYHLGMDLVGLDNKIIYAINDGNVVNITYTGAFGKSIVVQMSDGYYVRYSHLSSVNVSLGQSVRGGATVIGIEGNSGNVYGSGDTRHLDIRISKYPYHTDNTRDYINIAEYLNIPNQRVVVDRNYVVTKGEFNLMAKVPCVAFFNNGSIDENAANIIANHFGGIAVPHGSFTTNVIEEVFDKKFSVGSTTKPTNDTKCIVGTDRLHTFYLALVECGFSK